MNFLQGPFNTQQQEATDQGTSLFNTSYMGISQSPTQSLQHMFGVPPSQQQGPPTWTSELINDVRKIKL